MEEVKDQQQQGGDSAKVEKKFNEVIIKLSKLMSGEKNLLPTKKVGMDAFNKIVADLMKEDREKNATEIKEQLKKLLKAYADFKTQCKAKEEELAKLKADKMKEFVKEADGLFRRIDNAQQQEETLAEGLAEAVNGTEETKE